MMIGRLQHLQKMGLASSVGTGEWVVGLGAEQSLRDLGLRGDIIKTMHRAFASRGEERALGDYTIDIAGAGSPIIGRLVDRGLHDELTGEAYTVIDGTDGRVHHVRFPASRLLNMRLRSAASSRCVASGNPTTSGRH